VPLRASRPDPDSVVSRTHVVLRWPLGLLLVIWRYLWRTTPIHRVEEPGDDSDLPAALPPELHDDGLQTPADGVGPLLHRHYAVDAAGPARSPEDLVGGLCSEPNWGTPGDVAVFVKTRGEPGEMSLGDEYVVRMPGPWDGPVRVIARTPTSFRFATMQGHLEAGQIEFRASIVDDALRFEIESWARSGDRLSHVLYNRLLLAKEIQLNLWMETCLQVAARSGGRLRGGVRVHTRRLEKPPVG
jgi:hypothetical protein